MTRIPRPIEAADPDAALRSRAEIAFDDNRLVPLLYGEHDTHLVRIEHQLGSTLASRGNVLVVTGGAAAVDRTKAVLETLWLRLQRGDPVGAAEVDAAIRMVRDASDAAQDGLAALVRPDAGIVTRRKRILPRTPSQAAYMQALGEHDLVFGIGPAGTGKTYLAVAQAVSMLIAGRITRIILSRPAVEAGERLGFLPGDMREKVDPYLRPLYDALYDMLPAEQVARHLESGTIEIAPLAFMRGRTLSGACVILDEAQNTTVMQMRMALTRLGDDSRMVVTGDTTQIDLRPGERSGLLDALEILAPVEGVHIHGFTERDVVRHPLVARIVRAYESADRDAAATLRR